MALALAQGVAVLAVVLAVFLMSLGTTHPGLEHEAYVRALTFATLVLANLGLIVANLSWTRSILSVLRDGNKALWWVLVGALTFLAVALYVPTVRDVFRFGVLGPRDIATSFIAAALGVLWFEALKALRNRKAASAG